MNINSIRNRLDKVFDKPLKDMSHSELLGWIQHHHASGHDAFKALHSDPNNGITRIEHVIIDPQSPERTVSRISQ